MSTTQDLPPESWVEYFNTLTKDHAGLLATIETLDDEVGDQDETDALPLQVIGYDPRDRVLEVAVVEPGGDIPVLRRLISEPTTIAVEETGTGVPASILVTDGDGGRTLINLRMPAQLQP